MKQAITALANGGKYSATTFNLAFYLSSLLKKEMESEAADRDKEAKVNIAPYVETPRLTPSPGPAAAPVHAPEMEPAPFMFGDGLETRKKSKLPMAIAAGVVLLAVGAGAFMMLGKSGTQAEPAQVASAQTIPAPKPAQRIISQPIAVTPDGTTTGGTTTTAVTDTAAAQKKAFEDAVAARMQAEMMKLQDAFTADLQRKQSKNAPVATAPAPQDSTPAQTADADRSAPSAAQLDQQRRETRPEPVAETRPSTPAPVPTQTAAPQQPAVSAPAPAPAPQVSAVREGDVVAVGQLDVVPRITHPVKPVYPAMAMRQKVAATIVLTVLVSETGDVLDVRVLRGEPRFGLNDAAIRAMKATRFSSPMKDGKRVRTWFPQSIEFKTN
jgi:protein TonB